MRHAQSSLSVKKSVVTLAEWQTANHADLRLTEDDLRLLAKIAGSEGSERRFRIEAVNGKVRIETYSWVGVIELEEFIVQIQPKLAGGNECLVEMLEYTTGLKALKRLVASRTIEFKGLNLFDLLALLLVEACVEVVKLGLLSDYITREDSLMALRGRLLADRQLLKQFGRVDRLECRYDEYELDTPENQLLALALGFCSQRVKNEAVRFYLRQQLGIFEEVCDPATLNWRQMCATFVYNRLNEHYRAAHELAWLILERTGVEDLLRPGGQKSFTFLLDMNLLFEQFIGRVLEEICTKNGLRLHYQHKNSSILWNKSTGKPYRSVIPDFLIEKDTSVEGGSYSGAATSLPVDAKYKLYDNQKVSNADIYQTFLYAFAFNSERPDSSSIPRPSHALLLYPCGDNPLEPFTVAVRTGKGFTLGEIRVLGISVPALLAEIKSGKRSRPVSDSLLEQINLILSFS